ncbi:MAG: RpiB/LacA/LacB family sugar-phosphate isomerase [Holosporales bacterium]|jgi:2-polyprenyl-6-hydroxyphenyl methylase/3-demethylubiquinone-9 3-methyltransferase|nr:RpiB/LacA/LacB family sugar-phosphate isomerase [Holosporales bacterium]
MIFGSVAIAADHRGYRLKVDVVKAVTLSGYNVIDYGTEDDGTIVDYPDYAEMVATYVQETQDAFGVLICNSGVGMAIAANKLHGIRAVFCDRLDIVKLAREHNDANVICLGSAFTSAEYAVQCIDLFATTAHQTNTRYSTRIEKIDRLMT